jgi:hypothetical protein
MMGGRLHLRVAAAVTLLAFSGIVFWEGRQVDFAPSSDVADTMVTVVAMLRESLDGRVAYRRRCAQMRASDHDAAAVG